MVGLDRMRGGPTRGLHPAALCCLGLAIASLACLEKVRDPRPGIVVLIADDHAAESLGAAGHPWLRTPSLDRLAREGVRFTNAFVSTSLCAPARASFLTGQYVRRHGVVDNGTPLAEDAETFATLLTAAGYDSAYVGKWHIGGVRGRPTGFVHVASFAGQGRYRDCPFWIDGKPTPTSGHVDDVSTQLAINFLKRPRDGPFLLVLGFKGAHAPREPPARFEDLYRDAEISWPANLRARPPYPRRQEHAALAEAAGVDVDRFIAPERWKQGIDRVAFDVPEARRARGRRRYYETLTGVDDNVGRVLDALDQLSLTDETIVVYVSDNGAHLYAHGMADKRSAYEESMRVVTLLRYPDHVQPGKTIDELVLNVDLAPTLLDFAGLPSPAAMQGESWRGLLEGRSGGWRDAFVYEFYRGKHFRFVPSLIAIRTREAKWIDYLDRPSWAELFDLVDDPGETVNLSGEAARRDEVAALQRRLAQLEAELGPRYQPAAGTSSGRGDDRSSEARRTP